MPRPPSRSPSCGARSRSAQGGRDSECQRRSDGHGRRKRQHAPVEREARRAHGLGHEPFKKSHRGKGERDSGNRTERGEHQTFGKELDDQPAAARAKCGADRDFTAARGAARQQEIRQIDAGDQQERHRRAQQENQRGLCLARDLFTQRRDDHGVGASEILRRHLQTQCRHRLPGLLQRNARLEPRNDLRVVPGEVSTHPRRERRRHPEVDVARGHEVEVARHDADHFVGLVVERHRPPDDVGGTAEAALPQSVADDHDTHAVVVLVLGKDTPEHRLYTQHAPEGPGDLARGNLLGFPVARERRVARLTRREIREDRIETTPLDPFCWCGVVPRRDVGLPHRVPDHHETARIGVGHGADQHRVEGAEHRGNPADAERERRDRDRRERRIASDLPHSIAEIPPGGVKPGARASGPNALLRLLHAAHLEHSQATGLGGRRTVADLVGGGHLDKRLQFIVQIGLDPLPVDDPAQHGRKAVQEHHAPSSTLLTAKETRFHRSRCCSSWRRPAAVRR